MLKRLSRSLPGRTVATYLEAKGPNWATIIAWNALFAFFPLVLVTIVILGFVLQSPGVRTSIESDVASAFPGGQGDAIRSALNAFRQSSGWLAIISLLLLFWSGSALFGAIDQALNAFWKREGRGFVGQKLMSFGMILLFAFLAIPLLLSSSLLPLLRSLPDVPGFLLSGPAGLLIQMAAGILDATLLFLAIYWIVPTHRQRLRDVLPAAALAGVLVEAFTLLFPLYFGVAGGFATYGQTFALFFLLLTYFFFLGQITVIGGAFLRACQPGEAAAAAAAPGPPHEEAGRGATVAGPADLAGEGAAVHRPGSGDPAGPPAPVSSRR